MNIDQFISFEVCGGMNLIDDMDMQQLRNFTKKLIKGRKKYIYKKKVTDHSSESIIFIPKREEKLYTHYINICILACKVPMNFYLIIT